MVRLLLVFTLLLSMIAFVTPACSSCVEPSVATLDATDVMSVSATLHGSFSEMKGKSSMNVFFKWGTESGSYPNETPWQYMTSPGEFSAVIGPLMLGETYYFVACASSGQGHEKSFYVP